jgi:hypothetical protein
MTWISVRSFTVDLLVFAVSNSWIVGHTTRYASKFGTAFPLFLTSLADWELTPYNGDGPTLGVFLFFVTITAVEQQIFSETDGLVSIYTMWDPRDVITAVEGRF